MGLTTSTATVYQIRDRHRNQEVREFIPANYAGVLCIDCGKSYDARELAGVKQQKCVAHLQRSVRSVLETKWGGGRSFGLGLRRLLQEATALWHRHHAGTATDFAGRAADLRERLGEQLRERTMPDPDNCIVSLSNDSASWTGCAGSTSAGICCASWRARASSQPITAPSEPSVPR